MKKALLLTFPMVLAVAGLAPANDLKFVGPITPASIKDDLFFSDTTGNITILSVAEIADSSTIACGMAPSDLQIGRASGFAGMNGIALANSYLEDIDSDMIGATGGGCFNSFGGTGYVCSGIDPILSEALSVAEFGVPGAGPATSDSAIVAVTFDVAVATTIDLSYNFVTIERAELGWVPWDVFGILLDGVLLAGGKTSSGPSPGTDPWVLTPAPVGEFQVGPILFWDLPGYETGIRTLTIPLSAGQHSLSFHVADSSLDFDCGMGPAPWQGADDIVPSLLIVGPHTFWSGVPGTVTGTPQISRIGHPAPAGLYFPDDLQITLSDAPPASPTFLLVGAPPSSPLAGLTFPMIAPLEYYVNPLLMVTGPVTDAAGDAVAPASPIVVGSGDVGATVYFQWFGLDLTGPTVFNTKAMRVDFGI